MKIRKQAQVTDSCARVKSLFLLILTRSGCDFGSGSLSVHSKSHTTISTEFHAAPPHNERNILVPFL